nr:reverse transcriptase domain-containing protein [Tanacetum cinerariifolium]
ESAVGETAAGSGYSSARSTSSSGGINSEYTSSETKSELVYSEFMPPEDDVLLAEEYPLPAAVLPTADSLGYIPESDLEEDPKEDDEDLEEDPADYPTDREEEGEEESYGDDVDEEEAEEDEDEEEHPAPTDSVLLPVHRVTASMSVRAQTSISLPSNIEVARLLAIPTPPPSLLSPLSSPLPLILSPLPQILSPPLHISSPPLPATTDVVGLSQRMTDVVMTVRHETDEIYRRLDGVQDDRLLVSGELNMLHMDRRAYARTARLMESEAKLSHEAWVQSMDDSDTARAETQLAETLTLLKTLQTQVAALQRWQGPIRGPTYPEKMAPKRTTRSTLAITTTTTSTLVNNAYLKALFNQGVIDALEHVTLTEAEMAKTAIILERVSCRVDSMVLKNRNVFCISNCIVENQIKFATCTLLGSALTWWNSHVKTVGPDVSYAMTWTNLKRKMTNKYCPRGEVKNLEVELQNLKVKGVDVDIIEFTTELMDKKINTFVE